MMFRFNFENPYGGLNYDEVEKKLHERLSNAPVNLGNYQLSEYLKYFGEKYEQSGERIIVNPHFLRRMALSMAYTNAKQDGDLVPLALFGKFLRESANKFSPDFYKNYFRGKTLSEWLAQYPDLFEIRDNYVSHIPSNKNKE